jgi:TolA-binding protein
MFHRIFISSIISIVAIASEPSSAFGELQTSNLPHGFARFDNELKTNAKNIIELENRIKLSEDSIKNSENSINELKPLINDSMYKIQMLSQRVDNVEDLNKSIATIQTKNILLNDYIYELNSSINHLYREINQSNTIQKENFDSMSKVLNELATVIDNLKTNSVSKSEYESGLTALKSILMQEINKSKVVTNNTPSLIVPTIETNITKPKDENKSIIAVDDFRQKDKKEILSLAKAEFKENKFEASKIKFRYLLDSNYSISETAFYLGEIEFVNLNYFEAIDFYKKSYESNPSSPFADILLFHTGVSCEETDNKVAASNAYSTLTKRYKKSQFTKPAQDRINKLSKK